MKVKVSDFNLDSLAIDLNEYGGVVYLEDKPNLSFLTDHHTIMQLVLSYNLHKVLKRLTENVTNG